MLTMLVHDLYNGIRGDYKVYPLAVSRSINCPFSCGVWHTTVPGWL